MAVSVYFNKIYISSIFLILWFILAILGTLADRKSRFWDLSIHEAAHFIMTENELPGSTESISLEDWGSEGLHAQVVHFQKRPKNSLEDYIKEIKISLAGYVADILFCPESENNYPLYDMGNIVSFIKEAVEDGYTYLGKNIIWDYLTDDIKEEVYSSIMDPLYLNVEYTLKSYFPYIKNLTTKISSISRIDGSKARNFLKPCLFVRIFRRNVHYCGNVATKIYKIDNQWYSYSILKEITEKINNCPYCDMDLNKNKYYTFLNMIGKEIKKGS